MDTKLNHKARALPHPLNARKAAKLSTRKLSGKGGFSLATIRECEKHGRYPINRGTRMLYLSVLGLPTDNLDAPVAKFKALKP